MEMKKMSTSDRITRIEEKIDAVLEKVNKIEKVIFLGNGTPSALARLAKLEESNINTNSVIRWIFGIIAVVMATVIAEFVMRSGK
jgi:uncharacterized protein (DUF1786 family)